MSHLMNASSVIQWCTIRVHARIGIVEQWIILWGELYKMFNPPFPVLKAASTVALYFLCVVSCVYKKYCVHSGTPYIHAHNTILRHYFRYNSVLIRSRMRR